MIIFTEMQPCNNKLTPLCDSNNLAQNLKLGEKEILKTEMVGVKSNKMGQLD